MQIKGTYYTSIGNLDDARLKLENYINFGKVREDEFLQIKRTFIQMFRLITGY